MTTNVVITACCADDKEVIVTVVNKATSEGATDELVEEFVLQDGETGDRVVYDDRVITVNERVRETA